MKKNVLERLRSGRGIFLLYILVLGVCSGSFAQNRLQTKVTIQFSPQSLSAALQQLQKASKISIAFTATDVQSFKVPLLSFNETPIAQILQALLKNTALLYRESNDYILILPGNPPAQKIVTGEIHGRVVDFETAQPLPGATIQIANSAQGTITDEKGFYNLKNIPAGKYTLLVTYSGYQRNILSDVTAAANKSAAYDVKLQAGEALKEVVVNAGAHRIKSVTFSSDKQLLTEIRSASAVVSGISNEQISRTADRNAAEVVKRIAGVTVTDDRFIVVRGMNQRYNITYLNNNIAPSTELYSRAFAYDLLPTSIIDRILVYKSPTAELFGDYAGGAVKVFTKNAKPVRHLDVGLQLSYREGTTGKEMMHYNGGKYDALGFDDGTRKLPANMGNIRDGSGLVNLKPLDEKISGFNPDFSLHQRKAMPDMQLYVNYFDNWKAGRWRLYNLTSFTYQLDNRNYHLYRQTGGSFRQDDSPYYTEHDKTGYEQQATQIAKTNLLENLTLKFNDHHSLTFQNFLMNEGRNFTSSYIRTANSSVAYQSQQTKSVQYSFQQRSMYAGNLNGMHYLSTDSSWYANWSLGYTWYLDNRPDQRRMNYYTSFLPTGHINVETEPKDWRWKAAGSNIGDPVNLINGMMSRFFQESRQKTYTGAFDIGIPITQTLQLKTGSYHLFRTRDVARRYFKVNRYGVQGKVLFNSTEAINGLPTNPEVVNQQVVQWRETDLPHLWNASYFRNDGSGLELYDATTPVDAYVGSEQNNSGYLMTDWHPFNSILTVNAGVRVEYNRQQISSSVNAGGFVLPVYVHLEKTNLLPSVNITLTPLKKLTIRTGYGRTVNRPDFKELSPFTDRDYTAMEEITGNPALVSSTIDNYDIRLEWYPTGATQNELFNIGVFHKHIQRPIERFRIDRNSYDVYGYTSIMFKNPEKADVYGIEAEVRKSLSFIPGGFFRRLSLNLNGAWIKSEVSNTEAILNGSDQLGTFSGRPLQGQTPYVINAGLYYENAGSGTKIGVIYNVSGTSIYAVSVRNINSIKRDSALAPGILSTRPSILELPRHLLDFTISQRLYKSLQARFTVQNLLDQPYRLAEDNNDNYKYEEEEMATNATGHRYAKKGDNIFLLYHTGRFYNLSFTYAF
ncbi:carboxypeptidase-like regulatory domain-containing protein [Chitinophaga sp. RAB17]|uniref:TonB-dependent receptor n=1 Tax=Chitinophaga sp. RAB17 TaxID=3233049 RepID=UPI003F8DA5F5